MNITNMTELKDLYGHYNVYHDGVFVESSNLTTYGTTSCSNWFFSESKIEQPTLASTRNTIYAALGLLSLIGLVLAATVVIGLFKNGADMGSVMIALLTILGLAIVIIVGYLIFGYLNIAVPGL